MTSIHMSELPHYLEIARKVNPDSIGLSSVLLCLDPGETTGVAVFVDGEVVRQDQWVTSDIPSACRKLREVLEGLQDYAKPIHLVVEDYKVYSWKSDNHKWEELHTPKWIGGIVATVALLFPEIYITFQMAIQAKQFCTDEKLQSWNVYQKGTRHARDAVRHGIYHLVFNRTSQT